ncbi:MAG: hypothetical protein MRT15_04115 [archaeon YNP-LCB-003-016]|uniref:hypothetical protein n=1 Tax=Candidatus Culexarchaeum yellowstonense TaxID=2928963 RepID=UPI0026EF67DA|nr:hypothetical protein [Candidatus Culexarchaeum yellowstonense]MCR6691553.1 hypothetical protein [Candidatus Culexarchaeum yellowstonense]
MVKLKYTIKDKSELLKLKPEVWRGIKRFRMHIIHPNALKFDFLLHLPSHRLRSAAWSFIELLNRIMLRGGRILVEFEL